MRNLIRTALVITTLATPMAAFAGDAAPDKAPVTKPTDVKSQPAKDAAKPKTDGKKVTPPAKTDTKAPAAPAAPTK